MVFSVLVIFSTEAQSVIFYAHSHFTRAVLRFVCFWIVSDGEGLKLLLKML